MSDRTFYTVAELAKLLRVTPRTLQQWRKDRSGPTFVRIGNQIRYPVDRVEAYLESNTVRGVE